MSGHRRPFFGLLSPIPTPSLALAKIPTSILAQKPDSSFLVDAGSSQPSVWIRHLRVTPPPKVLLEGVLRLVLRSKQNPFVHPQTGSCRLLAFQHSCSTDDKLLNQVEVLARRHLSPGGSLSNHSHTPRKKARNPKGKEELSCMRDRLAVCSFCPISLRPDTRHYHWVSWTPGPNPHPLEGRGSQQGGKSAVRRKRGITPHAHPEPGWEHRLGRHRPGQTTLLQVHRPLEQVISPRREITIDNMVAVGFNSICSLRVWVLQTVYRLQFLLKWVQVYKYINVFTTFPFVSASFSTVPQFHAYEKDQPFIWIEVAYRVNLKDARRAKWAKMLLDFLLPPHYSFFYTVMSLCQVLSSYHLV